MGGAVAVEGLNANLTVQSRCFFIYPSIYLIYPDIAVTRPVQKFIIVRDDKQNITVLCQSLQPFGHLAHTVEVQSACWLVKNQKFLFAHNCLTDSKPLSLSARRGKRMPVDAVKQVKAIQQILNLLIGGIQIGRQALIFHTVRKKLMVDILHHHTELLGSCAAG